jgi:hypothetical protein
MTDRLTTDEQVLTTGVVVITSGASQRLEEAREQPGEYAAECLARHQRGDWGNVDHEDRLTNDEAVRTGYRVISSYAIDPNGDRKGWGENALWIITEADRSATTLLLAEEY